VVDQPTNNHNVASALSLGSQSCNDANIFTFTGVVPSDTRVHANPTVTGFDTASGSAPDFFVIQGTGGLTCIDDLSATFTVTGSASPTCYSLVISTDLLTLSCQASAAGTCTIIHGSGAYSDNSNIYFEIQKTCTAAAVHERVNYQVMGHL
jgi:hypothetical protein